MRDGCRSSATARRVISPARSTTEAETDAVRLTRRGKNSTRSSLEALETIIPSFEMKRGASQISLQRGVCLIQDVCLKKGHPR